LLQGIVNVANVTDFSLLQAFACATIVPANCFGLPYRFPLPTVGAEANFVAFESVPHGKNARVVLRTVLVNGHRYV
jgi:adenine deaminase